MLPRGVESKPSASLIRLSLMLMISPTGAISRPYQPSSLSSPLPSVSIGHPIRPAPGRVRPIGGDSARGNMTGLARGKGFFTFPCAMHNSRASWICRAMKPKHASYDDDHPGFGIAKATQRHGETGSIEPDGPGFAASIRQLRRRKRVRGAGETAYPSRHRRMSPFSHNWSRCRGCLPSGLSDHGKKSKKRTLAIVHRELDLFDRSQEFAQGSACNGAQGEA